MAAEVIRRSFRRRRSKDRKHKEDAHVFKFNDDFTRTTIAELKKCHLGTIDSLVFEGGGTKCLAYVGAVLVRYLTTPLLPWYW